MEIKSKEGCLRYRAVVRRVELSLNALHGQALVSKTPSDDDEYIYFGQTPDSNFLDPYPPNIGELIKVGVDIVALRYIIDKLNDSLDRHKYGVQECGPEELIKTASMKIKYVKLIF